MLANYLKEKYPLNSREWHLVRISFFNDYHRSVMGDLFSELRKTSPDSFDRLFLNVLCGSAKYSTRQWFRVFDTDFANMIKNKEDYSLVVEHFQVGDILESMNNFSDLVHGEGYTQRIKDAVRATL